MYLFLIRNSERFGLEAITAVTPGVFNDFCPVPIQIRFPLFPRPASNMQECDYTGITYLNSRTPQSQKMNLITTHAYKNGLIISL